MAKFDNYILEFSCGVAKIFKAEYFIATSEETIEETAFGIEKCGETTIESVTRVIMISLK